MNESNSGFSFGAPPEPDDGGIGDVDAIEVSGEPVSRSEAKTLGFVQFDTSREAKASSAVFRLDQLPGDISGDLSKKLEAAWHHLKQNDIDEALTLAQEVVWEYPSLVAAKVIIARCFINRKEYAKALNILQAVGAADFTAETHYYIALCQNRLGKIKEAQDALKQAKALPADPVTRKRVTDLALQLQGEQAVCPVCGKKVLYDSMVEVGDETVCANCAKNMPEDDGEEDGGEADGDDEPDDDLPAGKRRKRLRPPLTRTDILMRVVFVVFLAALLTLGVWAMSFVAPDYYAMIRSLLPASWTFLPNTGSVNTIAEIETRAAQQQIRPSTRRILSTRSRASGSSTGPLFRGWKNATEPIRRRFRRRPPGNTGSTATRANSTGPRRNRTPGKPSPSPSAHPSAMFARGNRPTPSPSDPAPGSGTSTPCANPARDKSCIWWPSIWRRTARRKSSRCTAGTGRDG